MCIATEKRALICKVGRDSALCAFQPAIAKAMHYKEIQAW